MSLADYHGRRPVLLTLLSGLWCPLCRRNVVKLARLRPKLLESDTETLAILGSGPERARLYFRFRILAAAERIAGN